MGQIGFVGLGGMGANVVAGIERDSLGGPDEAVECPAPFLDVLAPPESPEHGRGWGHMVPIGSGHYVKMVHNGAEHGIMQADAEGFSLFARHTSQGHGDRAARVSAALRAQFAGHAVPRHADG